MIDRAGRYVVKPQTRASDLTGSASSTRMPPLTAVRQGVSVPRPAPQTQPAPLRILSGADRAIITAGIFTAVASAGFATYMVSTNHSRPTFNGIEHLMLFAQPNSGVPLPVIARVPQRPDDQGIDFTSTGTIPENSGAQPAPIDTLPALIQRDGPIIKGFTLQGVSGNVAMVQGADGIYRLEPGTTLPGAGRVLAIQWRKGKFVVVTTRGIISEEQP